MNAKNPIQAFVSMDDGSSDILIDGFADRNRAFDGDEVVVRLVPRKQEHSSPTKDLSKAMAAASIAPASPASGQQHQLAASSARQRPVELASGSNDSQRPAVPTDSQKRPRAADAGTEG